MSNSGYKPTPFAKVFFAVIILLIVFFIGRPLVHHLFPQAAVKPSAVPSKVSLPQLTSATDNSSSTPVAHASGDTTIRYIGYAWNAQMGLIYANGGADTQPGSLMANHGVHLNISRQDDNGKMQEALTAFATQLSQGVAEPTNGVHFVSIMGDGGASFLTGLDSQLAKLGPGYSAKIVDAIGYSRGEDKFMGPAAWRDDPNKARGCVIAGVIRDGDWNIAQKWAGDNGIPNNPDEKTYDPNALNWVNASDYIDAAQKYVAGYSESRPVVVNGKRTGANRQCVVQGVVTWTPGDVTVAQKKGGLVSIVSTKEYSSQMPCVVIGIDKWMQAHRATVQAFIAAAAQGGQAVKANQSALEQASSESDSIYHEPGTGPSYWATYYRGTTQKDATGQDVDLGGSSSNGLADSLLAFGLVPGSADLVSATYTAFGQIDVSQYPDLMPSFYPAAQVIDTSYLQQLKQTDAPTTRQYVAARPTYHYSPSKVGRTISKRSWAIHFDPGSSHFSSDAKAVLEEVNRSLLIASGTTVEINGYTDSQGSHSTSLPLSDSRAHAVQHYLEGAHPANFPAGRIHAYGRGEANPVASNATAEGRAQNRRVEIILRSVN